MLDIIHQDDHLLVLNKPPGLPVLPDGWEPQAPYLLKKLEANFERVWVVHRLDKGTSGVMVFTRTAEAHRHLNRQFEQHKVGKVYQAILEGLPPWDEHTARHMLQTNVGRKHRTVVVRKRGKKSETHIQVIERGPAQALAEARPKTGRTHQVRVHLSALGYPLLGDTLYGGSSSELISRPALHAKSLTFRHPTTDKEMTFSVPAPNDFQSAVKRLGL